MSTNVDGLHQRAGLSARKVLELHGSTQSVVCTRCGARSPAPDALARPIGTALPQLLAQLLARLRREFSEGAAGS